MSFKNRQQNLILLLNLLILGQHFSKVKKTSL